MSRLPCEDPDIAVLDQPADVSTVVVPRVGDIGGFEVRRALPSRKRQMVGPFIFFDQMGPAEFMSGTGLDVRPHPHIGLATLTYLLDGAIEHRDSLGIDQIIRPGDVNLMTAGRGIVHSERTDAATRSRGGPLFGIQSWLALPEREAETAPAFAHHGKAELPFHSADGISLRVVTGTFQGLRSPVATTWEQVYVDVAMDKGARLDIPAEHEERALYPLSGRIAVGDTVYDPQQLLVLAPGRSVTIRARGAVRAMLVGGAAMDGPRHIWWNFVSSSRHRIEAAKADWQAGRFQPVPGETEFIPLPE